MTTRELLDEGAAPGIGSALMRVAWLAILLGLGVEVVLLLVAVFGGSASPGRSSCASGSPWGRP